LWVLAGDVLEVGEGEIESVDGVVSPVLELESVVVGVVEGDTLERLNDLVGHAVDLER
jgi:hypothetical protein